MQNGQGVKEWGRVVVVGSLNLDLVISTERLPLSGETMQGHRFTVNPSGKGANQAVAASLLAADVSLIGAVGKDDPGKMLVACAQSAGVNVEHVRTCREPTGVTMITSDLKGGNSAVIAPGANGTLSPADVAMAANVLEEAAVVCLCLEVGLETVLAAARTAYDADVQVLLNLSPYAEVPEALLAVTDILLVNVHEAALFFGDGTAVPKADAGGAEWEKVRIKFRERGIRRAVVTLGSEGSVVLDSLAPEGMRLTRVSTAKVHSVDTSGVGDAFAGALASRLAAGDSLSHAALFASLVAALSTTRKGAQLSYPNIDDIERFFCGPR